MKIQSRLNQLTSVLLIQAWVMVPSLWSQPEGVDGQQVAESFFIKAFPDENILIETVDLQNIKIDRRRVVDYVSRTRNPTRTIVRAVAPGFAQITVNDLRVPGDKSTAVTKYYTIQVVNEADADNERLIQQLVGADGLRVRFAGDRVVLEGEVENDLVSQKALNIASAFYPNRVLNFMTVADPLQVRIKVNVIAITLTKNSNIGLEYFTRNNPDGSAAPLSIPLGIDDFSTSNPFFRVFNRRPGVDDLSANLNLALANGTAKVLQSPTLTVLNAQPASFRVGGEFPIITQTITNNTITESVEYRPFGVSLTITPLLEENLGFSPIGVAGANLRTTGLRESPEVPVTTRSTIDSNGIIRLFVRPEVSELDFSQAAIVGRNPIVRQRVVETRVALRDGESLVLGGLIDDEYVDSLRKVPFIEKIPVFGELFKNRTKSDSRTEVLFILTPEIVSRQKLVKGEVTRRLSTLSEMNEILSREGLLREEVKPVRISASSVMVRDAEIRSTVQGHSSSDAPRLREAVQPTEEAPDVEGSPEPVGADGSS